MIENKLPGARELLIALITTKFTEEMALKMLLQSLGHLTVLTDRNLKPRSNHKRHLYMKKCKLCGKACKGAVGMATHITRYHNGNKWSRKGRAQVSATPMGSVSPNS